MASIMEPKSTLPSALPFGSLSVLMDDIDDWCGTRPPRPFPPKPHGIRDVLIAVAIHNLAAHIGDPRMRDNLQSQAADLYAAAGKKIAG